ncbi:DNA-binding MarR family transcriptional regulator [Roseiarcus fermentans]|uniref:DNA-binding MarR family transcriptional regulator n=1 Tax=Roseiarcus fermentans TaxID=1473586 RepID=A0A366EP65_9HYPH|nr:MarR family winged helix-turn-helix transcriptional regulator [Roseiarcus fermentans]RBP03265.1 DNA-binding MarR family transcriptional regulator [Roseiarcus fermentans]
MSSRKPSGTALLQGQLRRLHGAMVDIVGLMNRPQLDGALIEEAAIPLDRALFPLLVGIERFGPIGIVDLADRVGRDHTTVSRQVAKLESLGLAARQNSAADRRVRQAVMTEKGKAMTDRVDAARDRIGQALFEGWDERDIHELVRLMLKFADTLKSGTNPLVESENDQGKRTRRAPGRRPRRPSVEAV